MIWIWRSSYIHGVKEYDASTDTDVVIELLLVVELQLVVKS